MPDPADYAFDRLPAVLEAPVARGPVSGTLAPPGSKSYTNRALPLAAFASGRSKITGALDSEDTRVMTNALRELGISVTRVGDEITIDGCGGAPPVRRAELYLANSGTSIRFLAAMLAAAGGSYRLDGVERMRQRPIGDLLDALRQLGVTCTCEGKPGCPPVRIESDGFAGSAVTIRGDASSQFLSGLLMAAPLSPTGLRIDIDGPLVSVPYVAMTRAVLEVFDVETAAEHDRSFAVAAGGRLVGNIYQVEPDASAASYLFAAAAVTGGRVTVPGLGAGSLQGDLDFVDLLGRMGCAVDRGADATTVAGPTGKLRGIDADLCHLSDTVPTLGAVAALADGPTTIRNVAHVRHKETDRIAALAAELRKTGCAVDESGDGLAITPPDELSPATFATYDDHRMAMSLALIGLRVPGVRIADPKCVAKTYPEFFADLAGLL